MFGFRGRFGRRKGNSSRPQSIDEAWLRKLTDVLPGGSVARVSCDAVPDTFANTIAILQQTLAMFGSNMDVLRKMDLEQRIRELTDALIGMQEEWEKRFIVETNGPGVFEDPGLQTPDQADSRRGGITLSFPKITRVSQSEAGTLVDAMNGELRRRGSRI